MSTLLIDVEKVRKARCEMEREILSAVESAVRKFEDTTGLTPVSIYVDMADLSTLQSPIPKRVPCSVRAEVNIEL